MKVWQYSFMVGALRAASLAALAGVRAVLADEHLAAGPDDLAQEAAHYSIPKFDGLRMGFCCIDSGLAECDFCHDYSLETSVCKSPMGVMRPEAG